MSAQRPPCTCSTSADEGTLNGWWHLRQSRLCGSAANLNLGAECIYHLVERTVLGGIHRADASIPGNEEGGVDHLPRLWAGALRVACDARRGVAVDEGDAALDEGAIFEVGKRHGVQDGAVDGAAENELHGVFVGVLVESELMGESNKIDRVEGDGILDLSGDLTLASVGESKQQARKEDDVENGDLHRVGR